jgi:hypothetical protein
MHTKISSFLKLRPFIYFYIKYIYLENKIFTFNLYIYLIVTLKERAKLLKKIGVINVFYFH